MIYSSNSPKCKSLCRQSRLRLVIAAVIFVGFFKPSFAVPFNFLKGQNKAVIVYDQYECKLDSIVANLLADDIERISGYRPPVLHNLSAATGNVILIGSVNSKLMADLKQPALTSVLAGKWECYGLKVINRPTPRIKQGLIITGSDFRGTAYGVFDISSRLGISPWYWWADSEPDLRKTIALDVADFVSRPPSVRFRGIFINDEDWGLQPWAAKTFEPETGDIGPKTYAKVFELLLRLKANLIWPAMHPSTKAFYHYPGNIKVAEDYQIVIGSSHAEPMLRNNVSEWNGQTMGNFNYLTNQKKVDDYWESRVKESSKINAIYTIGMRGVHDSGIEGVKGPQEAVPLLERIFSNQRDILHKYVNPDITKVPQAFTAYKEVLDVYDSGLKVPEDVTLVWPDDNYGYIQRLNNEKESRRAGGSGVYYHISYWGRPHDYIWLSTTSPGLIVEEMTKAYEANDRNIWVVNVGDIKPAEYDLQLFLDIAYDIAPFQNDGHVNNHLFNWVARNLGQKNAAEITRLTKRYYQLAFERRPEFMGWSQTEPITPIRYTSYNHNDFGDQAQRRIDAYNALELAVKRLRSKIEPRKKDAFYELVYYPIVSSALMNKKFLYRDKAYLYAQDGRRSSVYYDSLSQAAYRSILAETDFYNTKVASGKWNNIISMHPRDLPVFSEPTATYKIARWKPSFAVKVEGSTTVPADGILTLPLFNSVTRGRHFVDVFLTGDTVCNYVVSANRPWIKPSVRGGRLVGSGSGSERRIWIEVDWQHAPAKDTSSGAVYVSDGAHNYRIQVNCHRDAKRKFKGRLAFTEDNGVISIYAKDFQRIENQGKSYWKPISSLGHTGKAVESLPIKVTGQQISLTDPAIKKRPTLTYRFRNTSGGPIEVQISTLPTFALNDQNGVRYAVSVDNGPATVLDFKTLGRSEEWKQAVLSNSIVRSIKIPNLKPGIHLLKIYMIDPGVILDHIVIGTGAWKPFYGLLPESKLSNQ